MFEAVLSGLYSVVAWPAIGWLVLGVVIGLYFGAVPGLSGLVGMAILLPFTFGMEPVSAFAFLLGMFAVTTTSDTIASVLLGIPGTAASQATILDGYPMARRGEAARAFGAAFTVSAFGGLMGAVILGLSIPAVKPLILSFAQPEFFMLGVLALTMVGSLSGGSMTKGLIAALLGLTISFVGYAENGAVPRYWFGQTYLLDGLPLIPLVLGLFALPEVVELAIRDTAIAQVDRAEVKGGMGKGIADAFRNWWLVMRATAIGAYVGLLPGLGGSIVDWVAYGHAVQSAKDKSAFGKGDVRGVIAPETANNAMKGGALIPTVAFGIPGSASMAILLGALLIQGLQPGPQMLTSKLDITMSMVWTLVIANVLGAVLLMLLASQISKVTFVRGHLIVPFISMFVFMGAWLAGNNMGDWTVLMVFGVLGYLMKQGGIPRPPLVLGVILGPIMENALFITNSSYDGLSWLARPWCLAILALVAITIFYAIRTQYRGQKRPQSVQVTETAVEDRVVGLFLLVLFTAAFVYAIVPTFTWPRDVGGIPFAVLVPAIALSVFALFREVRALLRQRAEGPATLAALSPSSAEFGRSGYLLVWLLALIALTFIAGQLIALPIFMGLYVMVWGGYRWWLGLLYAAAGFAFLFGMFDRVINVLWYPSLLLG